MLKFFSLFVLLFCLNPAQATLKESAKPISINIYLQQNPPFSYFDQEKKAQGILVDYWREWSRFTGFFVKFYPYQQQNIALLSNDAEPAVYSGLQAPPEILSESALSRLFTISSRFYCKDNLHLNELLRDNNLVTRIGGLLPQAQQLSFFTTQTNVTYKEYPGLFELVKAVYNGQIDALVLFEEGDNRKLLHRFLSLLLSEQDIKNADNELLVYAPNAQKIVLEWIDWGNQVVMHSEDISDAIANAANPIWAISSDLQVQILFIGGLFFSLFVYTRLKRKKDLQFKTLLDDSPYPLMILSFDGSFIYYLNSEVQSLFSTSKVNKGYAFDEKENQIILSGFITKASHKVVIETATIRLLVENRFHDIEISAKRVYYRGKTAWLCYFKDVNALFRAEEKLTEERELLRKVLDSIPEQILFKSPKGSIVGCNEAWAKAHNTTVFKATGKRLINILSAELVNKQKQQEVSVWDGEYLDSQEWLQQNGHQESLINIIKRPLYNDLGEVFALLSIESDVTDFYKLNKKVVDENLERKKAEVALAKQNTLLSTVFAASLEPIGLLDQEGRVIGANNAFAVLMGYNDSQELIGRLQSEFLSAERSEWADKQNKDVIESGNPLIFDELIFSEGRKIWYEVSKTPFKDALNQWQGVVIMARDITLHKKTEEQLTNAASDYEVKMLHDKLTGIANRRAFDLQFEKYWQETSKEEELLSLVMCDIDFFKLYNDNYGHQQGDKALFAVAQVLQKTVHELGGFVARYGGEEFVILIKGGNATKAFRFAEEVRQAVVKANIEHLYSSVAPIISLSMGLSSILPSGLNTMTMLLAEADTAMYESKKQGRNQISVFS